jgi:hypothetical protein
MIMAGLKAGKPKKAAASVVNEQHLVYLADLYIPVGCNKVLKVGRVAVMCLVTKSNLFCEFGAGDEGGLLRCPRFD